MNKLKKFLGEILTITGSALITYNLLDYSHQTSTGTCLPKLPGTGCASIHGAVYYYTDTKKTLITLGVVLIIMGLLIIKNKHTQKAGEE